MMGAAMLECHRFVRFLWALYRLVVSSTWGSQAQPLLVELQITEYKRKVPVHWFSLRSLLPLSLFQIRYMMMCFWTLTAERQTRRIRKLAFHNIMRQHIGWFDLHQTGELNVRLSELVYVHSH